MRKSLAVIGKLLVWAIVACLIAGQASAAEQLTRIAENVYAYVDTKNGSAKNSFGANAGIIIGNDGIVVVDTLISAREAKRFIREIRKISRKPVRYVINTHYHLDHVLGNSEFAKIGAVIIAQENAQKAMEMSAEQTLKDIGTYGLAPEDMKGTTIAYPVLTYDQRMTIDIGGQLIELIHARYSHTNGDTLVFISDKKVLFTGDILFTDYHPFLAEGNIDEWAKALDDIKAMNPAKIIPGHGPLSGQRDLDDMKAYIVKFDQKAMELASQSDDAQKIATAIQNYLPARTEGSGLILANIQMRYLKKQ